MTTLADLTPREISVASLVARCRTNKQIAAELKIEERWVRACVTAVALKVRAGRFGDALDLDGQDDRVRVALWYRAHVPITYRSSPEAA